MQSSRAISTSVLLELLRRLRPSAGTETLQAVRERSTRTLDADSTADSFTKTDTSMCMTSGQHDVIDV